MNLCVTGEWLTNKVVDEVKESKFFTVVADEVADVSNTEQMSIVVRYVDSRCEIKEEFIEFISCKSGTTGEALSENILSFAEAWNIVLMRGQAYDGASVMSGEVGGVQARIKEISPLAIYTHCYSHCLDLSIAASCQVQEVRNLISLINESHLFPAAQSDKGFLS